MLTKNQIQTYQNNGYLIFEDLFQQEDLDKLQRAAINIVDEFDLNESKHIFTTQDHGKTRDDYFLDSADKIRCFFEEDAFDSYGQLNQSKSLSINKIGHALHLLNPVFQQFSHQPLLKTIANDLGLLQPQIRQSMYIFKQPHIGGVVNWHQDASYFFTTPQSVTTFWLAIEDATLQNGCLHVQPEGHKTPLREQFIREKDGTTILKKLDNTPYPNNSESIATPVKRGTLIVFNGLLPH